MAEQNRDRGIKWGPFRAYIPLIHMRFEGREFVQGLIVALATGLALVPLLTSSFGLTFEEAVTISAIHSLLIASSVMVFGEPYAPGWITPALPFTLIFVMGQYDTPVERFQMMTALSLDFAALMFFLGLSGLGRKLMDHMPRALKAGIVLGASLAAFKRVFVDDFKTIEAMPVSMVLALVTCLIVSFSVPFRKMKQNNRWLAMIASFGLLPGFIVAGIAGVLIGEINFQIEWGVMTPPIGALMDKVSPFAIGWPSVEYFVAALPLALITYTILFGDLLTGNAVIKEAQASRPDDVIELDASRSHIVLAIRNVVMAVLAPFFPTQGSLWTGVHVVIVQRWKEGAMQSLQGGIGAYYLYGIPLFVFILPLVTFLKPFMPIALVLTLILTGFACAYVALEMPKKREERSVMMMTAFFLVFFDPWIGILIGLASTVVLLGTDVFRKQPSEHHDAS